MKEHHTFIDKYHLLASLFFRKERRKLLGNFEASYIRKRIYTVDWELRLFSAKHVAQQMSGS